MFLDFSGFEPNNILTLFLNVNGVTVTWSGNKSNIFKSLLMSYFIIKQIKRETE